MTDDSGVVSALFLLDLPEGMWVREVSERFPTATFRLLAGIRTDEGATELGEVRTDDPTAVEAAIRDHPAITRYERLESADGRLLAKYVSTQTGLYEFLESMGFPPQFPATVRDGRYELSLTGTPAEFARVRDQLDEVGYRYELLSKTTHGGRGEALLTDRQTEVLSAALRRGYLDVPRRCTLAELADHLGVDKSSVSETLRRGQTRLTAWFLTGSPGRE